MALTKITNDGVDFSGTTDINIDSGTLVVDASTDRVGVGTTSPLDTLHVNQSASGDILRLNTTSGSGQGILLGVDTSGGFTYWKNNTSSSYDMRFEVGGGEKLRIDSSGNVGIGTSSPQRELHVQGSTNGTIRLQAANTHTAQLLFSDSDAEIRGRVGYYHPDDALDFYSAGNERMRIDSSGRLLVGTSSNIFSQKFQVATTDGQAAELSRFNTNGGGPELNLVSSRNATIGSHTVKQSGDSLGRIWFRGSDGSNYRAAAGIGADVDNTPGTDDMPGRLKFYTTADGSASPTERMRIDSSGKVGIGTASPAVTVHAEAAQAELQLKSTSGTNSAGLRFVPGGETNALYIYADGSRNINFDNHATSLISVRSSGGITFNGDTATANALDDYEEGTWEPALTTAAGDFSSVTYHGDTGGRYTKIGQRVYLNGCVRITALTIGSVGGDALYISGLPFTSAQRSNGDNADDIGPLTTTVWTGGASSGIRPTHTQIIHNQNTKLRVWFYNPGSGTAQNVQGNDIGSTINIFISLVYTTSQ